MQSIQARRHRVARERPVSYDAGDPGTVTMGEALARLREARAALAAVDLDACGNDEVAEAVTTLVREEQRLAEAQTRLIGELDRRDGFRRDGCVSMGGWLRVTTRLGHGGIKRRLERARVLERMPLLAGALRDGEITTEHVDVISRHATPARLDRVAEHEETLTDLACDAEPAQVRSAVRLIVEALEDGPDDPPTCRDEDLRELRVTRGLRDLCDVTATGTPLLHELLVRTRDLYATPDPTDTHWSKRRTPAQKWHDALVTALAVAIKHHSSGGAVDGVRTHAVMFLDLCGWSSGWARGCPWRSGGRGARCPRGYAGRRRWRTSTAAVRVATARSPGARPTTSMSGGTAARPYCPTTRRCAPRTTTSSTRAAGP